MNPAEVPRPSWSPGDLEYGPDKDKKFIPNPEAGELLGYLSWLVTAAAVGGVIFIGIQMAMRLRAGEMGEGATYFRGIVIILGSCILGVTAGPLVNFVIWPYLLR
ncbi:hypothetical protein ACIBLA_21030 [Streptomyces sp. NPDC050433]|uniref:hypothetical protein n=1 Tax=unclassified Streptomyces TaxID=2593676 RepID=UPI00343452B5